MFIDGPPRLTYRFVWPVVYKEIGIENVNDIIDLDDVICLNVGSPGGITRRWLKKVFLTMHEVKKGGWSTSMTQSKWKAFDKRSLTIVLLNTHVLHSLIQRDTPHKGIQELESNDSEVESRMRTGD